MSMSPVESNTWLILIAVIAYIAGSFPTAYIITKRMIGKDIRYEGSGNVGAMNTYRLIKDNKSGNLAIAGLAITQATDMGKGMLAIAAAKWLGFLGYSQPTALIIASAFVIVGHSYPFCFKFKQGGRGIASLMGVLLALKEPSLLVWGGTVVVSIITAQYALIGNIDRSKFFTVLGTQVVGRVVGMCVALVPLYFFDHKLLFPVLAATIIILIRHIDRARLYLRHISNLKGKT